MLEPLIAFPVRASPAETFGTPVARNDGWLDTSGDEKDSIDRTALCRITDRTETSYDINIHAIVLARTGKVLFECYFRGGDEIPGRIFGHRVETIVFDADTLHAMKSVSKSVASLVRRHVRQAAASAARPPRAHGVVPQSWHVSPAGVTVS